MKYFQNILRCVRDSGWERERERDDEPEQTEQTAKRTAMT